MSCESKSSDLVTFNVGGKIYQVLREPTLSLHPTSLLTQMAEDQKDDKPIFVEGNQDLFQFVIDYHRDRKVILPMTVARDALVRELNRFGLEPTEEQIVEDGICFSNMKKRMAKRRATWAAEDEPRQKKFAAELLGSWYAKAALAKCATDDQGEGFSVFWSHVHNLPLDTYSQTYTQLFSCVESSELAESESLQDFAKAFGYSVTASGAGRDRAWEVDFKPAF
mmetsp:Transcript_35954/g.58881  ORF Transcript_35954/g.58881 Transcript_35954/m.58881 type:complete len:223 (-) Transcript_35954:32-700(-)